jgi:hypothetical protein
MSKQIVSLLLLLAAVGCSENNPLVTPAGPKYYLEVSAPVISSCGSGSCKPLLSVKSLDTMVTIKFLVSSENDPKVVAWALGPIAYSRVFDYNWDVWESKYVSTPRPDSKLMPEFGSECCVQGQKLRAGTFSFKKSDIVCVVVAASWNNGPVKHTMVKL